MIRVTLLLAAFMLAGCKTPSALDPDAAQTLADLQRDPTATGQVEYEGTVVDLANGGDPLYRYERRVDATSSTHVTYDPYDAVVVVHRAWHTADWELRRFETLHAQLRVSGSLAVEAGGELVFRRTVDGRTVERREGPGDPVVVGPTLYGFVAGHWSSLRAGESVPIRFAVAEQGRSYRFVLSMTQHDDRQAVVSMRARSAVVRAAVPTMRLVFDPSTRTIVRYEGRVPPQRRIKHRFAPLDARVDYRFADRG